MYFSIMMPNIWIPCQLRVQTKSSRLAQIIQSFMIPASDSSMDAEAQANVNNGKWTTSEHEIFLLAIDKHGSDWNAISQDVGTRTPSQVRSHAQKYYNKKINDQQRIGYNTEAIISGERSTRARIKQVKSKPQAAPKLSHSRQEPGDSGAKVPVLKKPIKKYKKEKKPIHPQPVPQIQQVPLPQLDVPRNTFQMMIPMPIHAMRTWEPISERENSNWWREMLIERLKQPGLDLSGMHTINRCGFRGAFKRVNL